MDMSDLLITFMFGVSGFLAGYLTGTESRDRWWRRELEKLKFVSKELKEIAKAKEKAK